MPLSMAYWNAACRPYAGRPPFVAPSPGRYEGRPDRGASPRPYVLVHGSWADAGFWDGIADALRRRGHQVFVPEYPGHGNDPNKRVTHDRISRAVADYIAARDLRDIALVGHSFGGSVIQKVAELVPERIGRLVFLNAFVLNDGESVADNVPAQARAMFEALRGQSQDDTIALPFPLFRDGFANLASLDEAKRIYASTPPEPAGPLFEKLDLKRFYTLTTPRSYVYLTEDNVLPQFDNTSWHPHLSSRLGLFRLIKGNGDHMSTARLHPDYVASRLEEGGRD